MSAHTGSSSEAPKYVLVEAVQQYRMRYVVELNATDPDNWALDTVVCEQAKELSQENLGETIVSHRVLPGGLDEAIALARADEPMVAGRWDDDLVIKNHITLRSDLLTSSGERTKSDQDQMSLDLRNSETDPQSQVDD